jgi:amidase
MRIQPGDLVVTKTVDSGGRDFAGVVRHPEPGNPLTGPFFIGAMPGDAIFVHFRKSGSIGIGDSRVTGLACSRWNRKSSKSCTRTSSNRTPLFRAAQTWCVWDLDVKINIVRLRDPDSKRIKLEFEARPMLGCIGVAARGDFVPTSGPAGQYGGNPDYNEVREGATSRHFLEKI